MRNMIETDESDNVAQRLVDLFGFFLGKQEDAEESFSKAGFKFTINKRKED